MKRFVDIELLREHLDDQARDAPRNVTQDLAWSDEELTSALEACAREWNSLPPLIGSIRDASRLPADTNIFLDGASSLAIERWLRRKQRERTAFEAGGITTDPDGPLIDSMTKLAAELRQRFLTAATTQKANRNWLDAFRRVG